MPAILSTISTNWSFSKKNYNKGQESILTVGLSMSKYAPIYSYHEYNNLFA